ncbi:MAG: ribonuclease P protein component, partial [bacterium]
MKSRFRKLYFFTKREIDWAFQRAHCISRVPGIKLLQASGLFEEPEVGVQPEELVGKILIIVPGRAGKAYKRNLFRRRAKAIFYENNLFIKPVTSILIVSSSKALELTYD